MPVQPSRTLYPEIFRPSLDLPSQRQLYQQAYLVDPLLATLSSPVRRDEWTQLQIEGRCFRAVMPSFTPTAGQFARAQVSLPINTGVRALFKRMRITTSANADVGIDFFQPGSALAAAGWNGANVTLLSNPKSSPFSTSQLVLSQASDAASSIAASTFAYYVNENTILVEVPGSFFGVMEDAGVTTTGPGVMNVYVGTANVKLAVSLSWAEVPFDYV